MKLTLQIKLNPIDEQAQSLLETMEVFNQSANYISAVAWENKVFNQFSLHNLVYYDVKRDSGMTAQLVVRCISKVANAYKLQKRTKAKFRKLGSITYDPRILSYRDDFVSISTISGRLKISFVCWKKELMKYVAGEADLIYRKGKFFLLQTIDIPDKDEKVANDFLGVDLGQNNIASTSQGINYSSSHLKKVRERYYKVRKSVQTKGTRGCKKLLKRLSGREQRFASITNHAISKSIVATAKKLSAGIALEDLTGIRKARVRKSQRRQQHSWSFYQLRQYIEYKAKRLGVQVVLVDPRYTSQTCNSCRVIGKRAGKHFECQSCGKFDADINAAKNISQLGVFINHPEKSFMYNCALHTRS